MASGAEALTTQLRGGAGPAGSLRPLLSNLCLTDCLGAGVGVSGIWRISLMAGGTLGEFAGAEREEEDGPAVAKRRLARRSLTLLGRFSERR